MAADRDFLEKHLENWIKNDPTLLGGDVRWVSQQLSLPGYRLDLLGLTKDQRWVIAELKAGHVGPETVLQSLGYYLALANIPNEELVRLVRAHGVIDVSVESDLDDIAATGESIERDYQLLVSGVGNGETAVEAAQSLDRQGFQIPVKAVTFELVRDSTGRRVLIREVDDTAPAETATRKPRETLLERADEFGVRAGFDRIRTELADRGFSEQQRGFGLNFNLRSRRNCLWVALRPGAIHLSYLPANFPALFGVDETEAARLLGPNELDLPEAEAFEQVIRWATVLVSLNDRVRSTTEPPTLT